MFVSSICELICLSMVFIIICEASITWNIKEEYVIYGRNTTLTCYGISCPSKAIRRWIGGPNYNLLCFDDYSTDASKYEMISNYTEPEFDLMIKSFNFSDANCEYTCSCGFLQYTKMLKLENINFIYLPVVEDDLSKQIDNTFLIDLSMKVFPMPTCNYLYEGNNFPVTVTVIETPTRREFALYIYTVRIQYTLDLSSYNCKGHQSLTCNVRSMEQPISFKKIDFCEEDEHSFKLPIVIVPVACIVIVIILVAITTILKCGLEKTRLPETDVENKPDMEAGEAEEMMLIVSFPENKADGPILSEHDENKSIE